MLYTFCGSFGWRYLSIKCLCFINTINAYCHCREVNDTCDYWNKKNIDKYIVINLKKTVKILIILVKYWLLVFL
jgi:hypothetical protein